MALGQLALLVRLEWIAGKRVAEVMTAAPVALMIVLTRHIPWSDMGARTNASQHHHAWVVFDRSHLPSPDLSQGEAVVGSWLAKHRSRRHECLKIRWSAKPGREWPAVRARDGIG